MSKKILSIVLIIVALGYYWLIPFGKLLFQYTVSSKNIDSTVSAVPDPAIEKVYILPSYEKINKFVDCGPRPNCQETTFNIKDGKNTVLITGQHFQSIDYRNPKSAVNISVNGQNFSPYKSDDSTGPKIISGGEYYAVQVKDNYIQFEVDSSLLSKQDNEITVTRDGKISRTFSLTNNDVSRQLSLAQSSSPSIIAAIPVGYPPNEYWAQGVDMSFLVTGLPPHFLRGAPEESISCVFKIDGKSYDKCYEYQIENLNIYNWQIALDKPSHEATLVVGDVSSSPFQFNTAQFEQIGKEGQKVSDTYGKNISAKDLAAGGQIPLIGQNKNGSLPALGINIFLTLIIALLFRPWRFNKMWRWIVTFITPVVLQALAGVIYGSLLLGGDFLAPVAGVILRMSSLIDAIVPLIEGIVVAIVLTYSIKYLRNLNTITINPISNPSQV